MGGNPPLSAGTVPGRAGAELSDPGNGGNPLFELFPDKGGKEFPLSWPPGKGGKDEFEEGTADGMGPAVLSVGKGGRLLEVEGLVVAEPGKGGIDDEDELLDSSPGNGGKLG
jgi:hypothetical protein